jgi:tetratricopeptide (TPR) repeat protein
LQKENDLLRVTMEQQQTKPSPAPDFVAFEHERQVLAEAKLKLAEQSQFASALQKENEDLKRQLTEARSGLPALPPAAPAGEPPRELQAALASVATLQASNRALKAEQLLLESRLADLAQQPAPQPTNDARVRDLEIQLASAQATIQVLEREKGDLGNRLEALTKELARRPSRSDRPSAASLEKDLEAARARIAVLEAQKTPYTPEELALFRQPALRVSLVQPTEAPVKKPRELPPGAGPLLAEADRAIDRGRFDEAERKYLEVLRQDENNVMVLTRLAAVQLDQDRLDDAEKTLNKALAIESRDAAGLYLLGSLKFRQEKFDEALHALSLSAQINPENAQVQYYLGKTLIQKGNRNPAEAALRKAIQLRPGWGDAHYLLAVVYATQQPPFLELAQWHYQKAIAGGHPHDAEIEKWIEGKKTAGTQ